MLVSRDLTSGSVHDELHSAALNSASENRSRTPGVLNTSGAKPTSRRLRSITNRTNHQRKDYHKNLGHIPGNHCEDGQRSKMEIIASTWAELSGVGASNGGVDVTRVKYSNASSKDLISLGYKAREDVD